MSEASGKELRERAKKWLIAIIALGSVAITTGTLTYSYPETLGPVRRPLILLHDLSGDLTLVALVVYLWVHLARVWKIKRQRVSRWTGYLSVGLWAVAGATGVYGQLASLEPGTTLYTVHLATAIALIGTSLIHGGWGFRLRVRQERAPSADSST